MKKKAFLVKNILQEENTWIVFIQEMAITTVK